MCVRLWCKFYINYPISYLKAPKEVSSVFISTLQMMKLKEEKLNNPPYIIQYNATDLNTDTERNLQNDTYMAFILNIYMS